FGPLDISGFRIFALILSFGSLFFFHRFTRAIWGPTAASVALALLASSFLWLQYADTLHHIPLYWCAGFASLCCAVRWLRGGGNRYLALLLTTTTFCFLASYDYAFFLPIMVFTTALLLGCRPFERRTLVLVGVVVVAGCLFILIKTSLGVWAVGWTRY